MVDISAWGEWDLCYQTTTKKNVGVNSIILTNKYFLLKSSKSQIYKNKVICWKKYFSEQAFKNVPSIDGDDVIST